MDTNKNQETKTSTTEQELEKLQAQLEAKKQEALAEGKEPPSDKELLREVLREQVQNIRTTPAPSLSIDYAKPQPTQKSDDQAKKQEREEEIKALVDLALTKSIEDAIRIAEQESPYILDELHDHLVDQYYDKLVQLGKIKAF